MKKGNFGHGAISKASAKRQRRNDEFQFIFNEASSRISMINKNISILEALSESFGSHLWHNDAEVALNSLSLEIATLKEECMSIFNLMSEYIDNPRNYHCDPSGNKCMENKLQRGNLKTELVNSLSRYRRCKRTLRLLLKSQKDNELHNSPLSHGASAIVDDVSCVQSQLIDCADKLARSHVSIDDLGATQGEESRIQQMQADIASMDKILGELATLSAHEQEDAIDSVDSNVEQAIIHIRQANAELQRAIELQRAKDLQREFRGRLCLGLIVAFVVCVIIGLVTYLLTEG